MKEHENFSGRKMKGVCKVYKKHKRDQGLF